MRIVGFTAVNEQTLTMNGARCTLLPLEPRQARFEPEISVARRIAIICKACLQVPTAGDSECSTATGDSTPFRKSSANTAWNEGDDRPYVTYSPIAWDPFPGCKLYPSAAFRQPHPFSHCAIPFLSLTNSVGYLVPPGLQSETSQHTALKSAGLLTILYITAPVYTPKTSAQTASYGPQP